MITFWLILVSFFLYQHIEWLMFLFLFVVNNDGDSEMETLLDLSPSEAKAMDNTESEVVPDTCCKFRYRYLSLLLSDCFFLFLRVFL